MRRRICASAIFAALTVLWWTGVASAQTTGGKGIDALEWFVIKGGVIGWLLILIDVLSWGIIIKYFIEIRRLNILPEAARAQIAELMDSRQYREVIQYTAAEPSFLSYVVHQGLSEASHGYAAMERAMEEASEERTTKMLRKIELLNIIGNISPMMGLLGTVFGMIMAFSRIVEQKGMPPPDRLAGDIGIALVTTFWGLIVAIPALAVYASLRNRIDGLTSEAMMVAQEVLSTFRPTGRKSSESKAGSRAEKS